MPLSSCVEGFWISAFCLNAKHINLLLTNILMEIILIIQWQALEDEIGL